MRELIEAQLRLQARADDVVSQLQLEPLLGALGRPVRVGSSAMALMVRRDIDITVICAALDEHVVKAVAELGAGLLRRTSAVASVRLRNDTGTWNVEPDKYPDGLYLGVTVRDGDGEMWTLDIWFVDQPDRQPDLAHLKTLLPRLTDEHRYTILGIKQALAERPKGAVSIPSALVYEAVVDHGIGTVAEFETWHDGRDKR